VSDPWILAPALFAPCYVGGWTAAHHWDLTEQLFNDILIFTTRHFVGGFEMIQGVKFVLRHTQPDALFGLKSVWRGETRVLVSDKPRTLIDLLALLKPEAGFIT